MERAEIRIPLGRGDEMDALLVRAQGDAAAPLWSAVAAAPSRRASNLTVASSTERALDGSLLTSMLGSLRGTDEAVAPAS